MFQFVRDWTQSPLLGAAPWVLLSIIQSLYIAFFGGLTAVAWRRIEAGLLLAPFLWAAVENFRCNWPAGGFGWGQLSYSQWEHPLLIQAAAFGSSQAVGSLILLVNVGIVYALGEGKERRLAWVCGAAALAVLALSFGRLRGLGEEDGVLSVTIGQPALNIATGSPADWVPEYLRFRTQTLNEAADARVRLAVFPEGYQIYPPTPLDASPVPYLVTGQRNVDGRSYQTAYGIGSEVTMRDKTRLVIFGEYVPWRDKLPFLNEFKLPGGDIQAGSGSDPLTVGDLRVGVAICFESVFGEVLRDQAEKGVNLLAVMTMDDWFPDTEKVQHASASVIRAVENGVPLIRSASSGLSMAVDGGGNILATLPLHEQKALSVSVPRVGRRSPFVAVRWFPLLCYLSVPVALLGLKRRAESR